MDLTDAWADIHKLGRFPRFIASPTSEAHHQENQAWKKLYDAKHRMCGNGIPEDVWQEMQNYSASQPVDELQALICQVRDWIAKFGKCPIHSKTNKDEYNLAQKLDRNKDKFTAAQKRELKELQDGASQPVVDLQALICEVRDWIAKFGKFPTCSKTNKDQANLAKKLTKNKDKFTAAQKLELKELKDGPAGDYFMKGELNEVKQLGYYPKEHQANVEESQLAARLRTACKKTDFSQHDEDPSSDSEMLSRGLESDGRANPSAMSGTSRPKFDNGALIFGLGDGTDLRIENPAMLQDGARRAKHTTTPQVATAATEDDSAAPKLGTHEDKVDIEARLMLEFAIGNPTASYKCMKTATHLIMQSMSDCTSPHKP